MKRSILTAVFCGVTIHLSSAAFAHDPHVGHVAVAPEKRLLPVTATAQVKAAPDMVTVTAGVVTEGRKASETATENAATMTAIYNGLDQAGVTRADISTTQLSLSPRYDYENRKKPRIIGYTASNIISVKTRDLNKVTPIIDALVLAGTNSINNVQFSLSDPDAVKAKVLEEAIKKARAKAHLIARSAGVTLGALQSITVDSGGYSIYNRAHDEVIVTSTGGGGGASTPVSQGDLTISATVNLVYEMR